MSVMYHIREFFFFWKPTISRKITLYFAVFGLLVFYITSFAYLLITKSYLVNSVTRIVRAQISEIQGMDQPDAWWGLVGQEQQGLLSLAQVLTSFASGSHTIRDVSIYARLTKGEDWQRLYLDKNRTLRTSSLDESSIQHLSTGLKEYFIQPDSDLYLGRSEMAVFINITTPADRGQYYYKVIIDREGVTCLLGNRALNFLAISFAVLFLLRCIGYFFARRVAAPLEILSAAAAKVAKGDLSPQVPALGQSEIGDLGRNFNTMIMGLREWQRIKIMEVEMEKGREIQQSFLPTELPRVSNWDIATSFYPANEVAGDFYDVFDLPGGFLGLVIADVSGKGVGAALYMALIRSLVRVFSEQILPEDTVQPSAKQSGSSGESTHAHDRVLEVIRRTNSYLVRNHGQDGMFATMFFGVLDPTSGSLVYVNSGHEPLYIIGKDGVKEELRPTGPVIGVIENLKVEAHRLQIEPGDLLLGLTDGVTEAFDAENKLFTRSRVKDILGQPMSSAKDLLERIRQQVFDFAGKAPQSDDITLLAVQRIV
ncbi:Serine phosphatase RsbU, regulator of sigma subunit [Desulfomicrobium norvegicum]|uniref:Serine phosphatase RsbU, regulator of sigma subunit n=1 Tax=Desulfomicrobium norvegicum (strain DSM 1741 / NCIMB 8310) TaxID=52561 RepID=A0A8G2C5X7_DESNO|nr:SpoIIE family protein phosphatase [Desulfomicrobium norvegicum]SFM17475.1 Serine phosphatase RsbU, regulator of sigma subunit [Desulfomicrobium norvegicum]